MKKYSLIKAAQPLKVKNIDELPTKAKIDQLAKEYIAEGNEIRNKIAELTQDVWGVVKLAKFENMSAMDKNDAIDELRNQEKALKYKYPLLTRFYEAY